MLYVDIKKNFSSFHLNVKFHQDGGILGLLGSSGCGKSLTMKSIAGIVRPDRGRVILDGKVLFDSDQGIDMRVQDRNIGYLFQDYLLFPNMTVKENIVLVMKGKNKKDKINKLHELLEIFSLESYLDHYPDQLSGGQKQRVALARMLASEPDLIMLDEPLSALDSYLKSQIELDLLKIFNSFKGNIIYVSHNRDEINRFCQDVCVIEDGKIVETLTKDDLFLRPQKLASAKLSGCKNFSRAAFSNIDGKCYVYAKDWGIYFEMDDVKDLNKDYMGIRSHHFEISDKSYEDSFSVEVIKVIDNLFETRLLIQTKGMKKNKSDQVIMVDLPNKRWREIEDSRELYCRVSTDKIMLLNKN